MDAPANLIAAPVIDGWYRLPTADGGWCISGIFAGDQDYPNEIYVGQTGRLIAEGNGWCQTERRVYALGRPRGLRPAPLTPEQMAAIDEAFGQ